MSPLFTITRTLFVKIDKQCGTNFKPAFGNIYRSGLRLISPFLRWLNPLIIRLAYSLKLKGSKKIKLHLGCGHKHFDGYVNMDLWLNEAVDVVGDITQLPFDEAVKEYLAGKEIRLENIFGHQRFPGDAHMFGYTPKRLILSCIHT